MENPNSPLADCLQGNGLTFEGNATIHQGMGCKWNTVSSWFTQTDSPSSVLTLQRYRTRVPLFSIPPNSLASHYLYFSGFIPRVEVVVLGDEIALFFMSRSFQWVIYYCIIKLQILFLLGNVFKRKPTIWSDLWCAVDEKQKPKTLIRNPEMVQLKEVSYPLEEGEQRLVFPVSFQYCPSGCTQLLSERSCFDQHRAAHYRKRVCLCESLPADAEVKFKRVRLSL